MIWRSGIKYAGAHHAMFYEYDEQHWVGISYQALSRYFSASTSGRVCNSSITTYAIR